MASDIILDGEKVKVKATDLILDDPGRRKNNRGERRALVHDFEDRLVLNYAKDYPGGVKIDGNVAVETVSGKDNKIRLKATDLILDEPGKRKSNTGERRALVHGTDDKLILNYEKDYPGGVKIEGEVYLDEIQIGGESDIKAQDLFGVDPNGQVLQPGQLPEIGQPGQPLKFQTNTAIHRNSIQATYLAITGDVILVKRSKLPTIPIPQPILNPNPANVAAQTTYTYQRISLLQVIGDLTKRVAELERKVAELSK